LTEPGNGKDPLVEIEDIIDFIEEGDVITEFKTSSQMMNEWDVDESLQLTIYNWAYEKLYGRPPVALKVIDFVKSRKPKLITLETKRDPTSYKRLFGLVSHVLNGIRQRIFFPRVGFWCKDCEYSGPCQSWQGN